MIRVQCREVTVGLLLTLRLLIPIIFGHHVDFVPFEILLHRLVQTLVFLLDEVVLGSRVSTVSLLNLKFDDRVWPILIRKIFEVP